MTDKQLAHVRADLRQLAATHPSVCDGIYARAAAAIDALLRELSAERELALRQMARGRAA